MQGRSFRSFASPLDSRVPFRSVPFCRALSLHAARRRYDERARHLIKKQADDSTVAVDLHCLRARARARARAHRHVHAPRGSFTENRSNCCGNSVMIRVTCHACTSLKRRLTRCCGQPNYFKAVPTPLPRIPNEEIALHARHSQVREPPANRDVD